jgi:hypothetical protein
MPKEKKQYKRLPGKRKSYLLGFSTLWLGRDHLLFIDSKRFSEDYTRFYFHDIQAIITRRTKTGKIQNIFLGAFCGFFILMSLSIGAMEWSAFFWLMAGMFGVVLFINWLRGPTCVCHLQTAVQTKKLTSLHRLKTAQKAINLLRPFIEHAQGKLTPEVLKEEALKEAPSKPELPGASRAEYIPRHEPGNFHNLLFFFLLFAGLITVIDIMVNHVAITLMNSAIAIGTALLVITALVKQHESDIKGGLNTITWIALGYVCYDFLIGYMISFIIIVKDPKTMSNQWELIKRFSALSPQDNPWLTGLYVFSICCAFALGIFGLTFLKKFQRHHELPVTGPNISAGVPLA